MSNPIEEIKDLLSSPKKIVITNHINPDGDAMGSALALYIFLQEKGHEVQVIIPNEGPSFLHWLPKSQEVLIFQNQPETGTQFIQAADIIFSLDYNTPSRAGEMGELFATAKATKILIDHHQDPDSFPDYSFSDTTKGSTCQMIYEWICDLGNESSINLEMAQNLYTGILTDSGSFRFASTTPETHRIVAKLLELGVRPDHVYQNIFDTATISRYKLLGILLDKMEIIREKQTAIMNLSLADMNKWNAQKGDTEGFVNYGLGVNGVVLAAFFKEDEGKIKISFRSKGDVDVNELARKHFNGGGHKNAAGGMSTLSLEETIAKFKSII